MLYLLDSRYQHTSFGIFPYEVFSLLLHLFIYSIIFHISMNSWVFIFWVIAQYHYIYFIGHIVPALTTSSLLSWLLCFFDIFYHCILFYVFGHFLTQLDAFIFPVPILARAVLPRILGSFYWRLVLETKIWVVDVLVTTGIIGMWLFLRRASQVTQW